MGALRVGGGALGPITDTLGVRFDLSFFRTFAGPAEDPGVSFGAPSLSFWRASVGLVLR
jgi:hypothetical protein